MKISIICASQIVDGSQMGLHSLARNAVNIEQTKDTSIRYSTLDPSTKNFYCSTSSPHLRLLKLHNQQDFI